MNRFQNGLNSAAPLAIGVGIVFGLGCIFVFSILKPLTQLGAKPSSAAQEAGAIVSFFEQDRDDHLAAGQTSFCHIGTFKQSPGIHAGIGELAKIGWVTRVIGVDFAADTLDWTFCWSPDGVIPTSIQGTEFEGQAL